MRRSSPQSNGAGDLSPLLELPAVLDTVDVARVLRVSIVHARRLLASGKIPSRRLGRRRLVLREVLLRMLRPERGLSSRHPSDEAPPSSPAPVTE